MRLVIIESPYAGDIEKNVRYARACLKDSLDRGEAPFASHLLYTQVLDDSDPEQRKQGIEAGFAWDVSCSDSDMDPIRVFYVDRGVSPGMQQALETERDRKNFFEIRRLGGEWAE